jgi:hypothetical protein
MRPSGRRLALSLSVPLFCLFAGASPAADRVVRLSVEPADVLLCGSDAGQSLLVTGVTPGGNPLDLTRDAQFRSEDASIARIDPSGWISPAADGTTTVTVESRGSAARVKVVIRGSGLPRRFNFENQVVPILSKLGCNSGGCHGKAEGQNGFKLSVFGFDPPADYEAIVKQSLGRRVMPAAPEQSLFVTKPLGRIAHGGGVRLQAGSREMATLVDWIGAGLPFGAAADPVVERIEVRPEVRSVGFDARQQLQVTAFLSDGSRQDVTPIATYASNLPTLASVSARGLIQTYDVPGEAAIMVGYLGRVAVSRVVLPQKLPSPFARPPANNFIDERAWDRLELLGIPPSGPCGDDQFLRRVSLDLIGTLPTPGEVRAFLKDARPDKRARLVDALLERPEYADFWALKWADILRVDRQKLLARGATAFHEWLRGSIQENKPYDRFVREIVTAQGASDRIGPANFYRVLTTPEQLAGTVSQIFLGVRIECAQCHHHPFDKWTQDDFHGMVGFFTQVRRQPDGEGADISVGPPVAVKHPRTGLAVPPHALEAAPLVPSDADPRVALADWLTSPANRWFSRAIANRLWAHCFGRGLVEPVDDMRETAPASNEPLLAALARYVVEQKFDLRKLIRAIVTSQVYQRSEAPAAGNEKDERNFSRAAFRSLPAEVLLDAIGQATGRPERFALLPEGTRAIQLWDNRMKHYFLEVFGRPLRVTACECERISEPSVAQVLHLMNSPEIQARLGDPQGRVHRLLRSGKPDDEIVEELFLAAYARLPGDPERRTAAAYLKSPERTRARSAEDLLWSLMNTAEFLYNH